MGTTSQKLTYLNETKQQIKEKINNLGGSITSETTFRNYANQLQNVYDNYPKTEYQEGTEVNLGKTIKGKLDYENGVVGIGQTEQDTTNGTNLANTLGYIAPTTTSGVTYSLENNIISLNGTATTSLYINLPGKSDLASGSYTFAPADISGTYTGVCGKYPCVNGIDIFDGNQLSTLVNRTLNSDYTDVYIRLFVSNGSSYSNYKCKLNLVKGTYTAQTIPNWEKYTGGQTSPNPSYPQEIKYVRGKNRLDESTWEIGSINATTGQNAVGPIEFRTSGYIEVNGSVTLSNYNYLDYTHRGIFEYDSNKNYIKRTNDTTVSKTTPFTLNLASNTRYIRIRYIVGTTVISIPTNMQIQLEEGTQATPYLPYNTIEEVVSGKNLFDIGTSLDDWFQTSTNGTKIGDTSVNVATATISNNKLTIDTYNTSGWNWISKWVTLKKNTDYIISGTNDTGIKIVGFSSNELQFTGTELASKSASETTKTFNSGDYDYYCLSMYPGSTGKYIENIQIEANSTATTYEPYITPTSYQLSLGEYKFYGIGNYKDELIYDVDEDRVYKDENVNEHTFTENDNISLQSINSYGIANFFISHSLGSVSNFALCNYFELQTGGISVTQNEGFLWQHNGVYFRIKSSTASDVSSFKTWLNSHSVKVEYALAETSREEITDTTLINQVKALYNAHSLNGTTIITSNGNLPMIIKVRGLKGE